MADAAATALAEACSTSTTLRLLRFDEAELPVPVLRGAVPEALVELRSPDTQAAQQQAEQHAAEMIDGDRQSVLSGGGMSVLGDDMVTVNSARGSGSVLSGERPPSLRDNDSASVYSAAPSTERTGRSRMRNKVGSFVCYSTARVMIGMGVCGADGRQDGSAAHAAHHS